MFCLAGYQSSSLEAQRKTRIAWPIGPLLSVIIGIVIVIIAIILIITKASLRV